MDSEQNGPVVDSLIPVGFRLLLNIYKAPSTTAGGFIRPEQENSGMPVLAQVVKLGKKTLWQNILVLTGIKPKYKIGQWIYFRKYSVDELRFTTPDGELALFVLEENEIVGIVNVLEDNVKEK